MQLNNGFILIHNTTATQPCDMMLFIRITRSKNINTILGSDHKYPLEKGSHTYQGKLETNTVLNFIKVLINKPFLDSPIFSPLPLTTPRTPPCPHIAFLFTCHIPLLYSPSSTPSPRGLLTSGIAYSSTHIYTYRHYRSCCLSLGYVPEAFIPT